MSKTIGEMNGAEFAAANRASTGLREPSDPKQLPGYVVASAFIVAAKGFTDRDLIDRWVIGNVLGSGNAEWIAEHRPLVEKAIGRTLDPAEIRRYPLAELIAERDRRQNQSKDALFD